MTNMQNFMQNSVRKWCKEECYIKCVVNMFTIVTKQKQNRTMDVVLGVFQTI